MKTPDTKFIAYVSVIALTVLGTLSGTLICTSNLFPNSKYSFVILILIGAAVIVYNILKRLDKISEKAYENTNTEKQKMIDNLNTLNKAKDAKIAELTKQLELKPVPTDIETLQKKCDAIESFRNSFPYKIADGYVLYNIIRTELSVSSHSRWLFVGQHGDNLWAYSMIRPDTQSYKELLSLAASTTAPQELEELDQSTVLLWK